MKKEKADKILDEAKATLIFRFDGNDIESKFYKTSTIKVVIDNSLLSINISDSDIICLSLDNDSILYDLFMPSNGNPVLLIEVDNKKEIYDFLYSKRLDKHVYSVSFKA